MKRSVRPVFIAGTVGIGGLFLALVPPEPMTFVVLALTVACVISILAEP